MDIVLPNGEIIKSICPCLGIGDILIEKMKESSNNLYIEKRILQNAN